MPDKKYKTPNGQIVSEKELQSKYGEKFNSLLQNKTFSEVNEPVYKTPNGKYEIESVLEKKYGEKFNELKKNNTFILDVPKKKIHQHLLLQRQVRNRYRRMVLWLHKILTQKQVSLE
jgi:hypothetical protein